MYPMRNFFIKKSKYIFFLISAMAFLMLASRSSFLYVFNNWDDANSYLSVGKALFNGKMPYRDVFDQKGMYLYFFYGLAYLVSHTTFAGVYILEVILAFFNILGFYKILRLYTGEKTSLIFAPLTFVVAVVSKSFWWGGAAEEICLPFYVWGLYLIVRYFREDYHEKTMPMKQVFFGGILAGIIANIKFTGLGFFFAWMMMVWFSFIFRKEFAASIKACLVFLFGMFVTFIPWIIYFGIQGGLYEWYWGYVYINVFLYPKTEGAGLGSLIYSLAKILYFLIRDNYQYFAFVIVGLIYAVFSKTEKFLGRLVVPVLFAFLFLGIFIGGRTLPYYSLPLSVFAVFGFALLGSALEMLFTKETDSDIGKKEYGILMFLGCGAAVLLSMLFIYNTSMNISYMKDTDESFFLFRFRDEVLEKEDPTLLNVGCLDAGLYTLTDIVPSCRWFQTQTLDVPEPQNNPYLEQDRYVREGLVDFVIARDSYPECIYDKYELIDSEDYSFSGSDFKYYLFRKK